MLLRLVKRGGQCNPDQPAANLNINVERFLEAIDGAKSPFVT